MKRIFLLLALMIVIITSSCNFPGLSPQKGPQTASGGIGLNLLVTAAGDVQLKRSTWTNYSPTSLGALLYTGDQILPAKGAKAVILCDGLTQWQVPTGAPSGLANGCPPSDKPILIHGASHIGGTRGGNDPLIPYIVTPRKTLILTATPTFRWNAVSGAKNYVVRLNTDKIIWEQTTNQNSIVYPGDPALKPGVNYLLTIEADNGKRSQDEGVAGLGFSLMTADQAAPVLKSKAALNALNLSAEAEALALAQLYQGNNLTSEAIEVLNGLASQQTQVAAVYRMLGDLYLQSSLNLLAADHYQRAIDLAQTAKDIEGQAVAQAGLGEAEDALGQKDRATAAFNQALENYKLLGDQKRIDEMTARIGQLK
jgi:hypothetical protein